MITDQKLSHIKLTLLHKGKKVFSGKIDDLPDFFERKQPADQAKIYSTNGSAVALMRYNDLKQLVQKN